MFRSVISDFYILECEAFSKEIFWETNVSFVFYSCRKNSFNLNENKSYSKENTFFFVYSL